MDPKGYFHCELFFEIDWSLQFVLPNDHAVGHQSHPLCVSERKWSYPAFIRWEICSAGRWNFFLEQVHFSMKKKTSRKNSRIWGVYVYIYVYVLNIYIYIQLRLAIYAGKQWVNIFLVYVPGTQTFIIHSVVSFREGVPPWMVELCNVFIEDD